VTAGLVVLALAIVGLTKARNRSSADQRASTRALWAATAVNAASALLRRGPDARPEARPDARHEAAASGSGGGHGAGHGGGGQRSALLIGGGLAMILLAFLFPSGKDDGPDAGLDPDAPDGPDAEPGPDDTA
jgi:hypothetical protein